MAVEGWPKRWTRRSMTAPQARVLGRVVIAGSGAFLPGDPIDNRSYLEGRSFPTSAEWIEKHTGIRHRHHAKPGTATSDLAAEAARVALESAEVDPVDVERILLCTTTGDWTSPAAASRVQSLLGAECPAVDLQAACASWVYGLDAGIRLVLSGLDRVLVIGADVKSRFVGRADHRLGPVFADGAGAVLLRPAKGGGGFLQIELYCDGSKAENLVTPAGGSALPATQETVEADLHTSRMAIPGSEIRDHAAFLMSELARQVCDQEGIGIEEVDFVVPHQANAAVVDHLSRHLDLSAERVVMTIDRTANIVSGTLPFAFDDLRRSGQLSSGNLVLFVTAGGGYAGGAALYEVP